MQQYARKLVQDIAYLESHPVSINGFSCKFTVELVPADMKWLSAMAGELNNAACFFSPFGDVNTDNMNTSNGSLGEEATCTWHPWRYEKRVEMAKKVAAKKEQLSESCNSSKTQRNKLLNFMKAQGSCQEHEPVLGKLIEHGFAQPLHNSNNAWAFLHYLMLEVALSKSNITQSCNDIDQLPEKSTFVVYLTVLKDVLRVSRLVRKVKTWSAECRKCPFSYRFTGKETKVFCRKFMFVLQALSDPVDSTVTQLKLASIAFCCVQLRDAVSYFSRVNITQAEVEKCKLACLHFFNACVLLFKSVTPTLWTVGYAIPRHLQILFDRYGMGLGLNSMQGREAKHVRLSQFAKHSTKSTRWSMVLRHDYISNVWVRKHEPAHLLYTKYKAHYIPNEAELETFCYCGFPAKEDIDSCSICSSSIYKTVQETAVLVLKTRTYADVSMRS